MLGQMVNVTVCTRCQGEGRVVDKPCQACRGEGRQSRHKKIRVSIPAGIDEGHQIRLSGEGEAGTRGGPAGNLYVAVHVTPHEVLRREGTEIYYDLQLSIAQAALGTIAKIPTIEGEEELEIRPGTQPGTEIRLRGQGRSASPAAGHARRPACDRPGPGPDEADQEAAPAARGLRRRVGRGSHVGRLLRSDEGRAWLRRRRETTKARRRRPPGGRPENRRRRGGRRCGRGRGGRRSGHSGTAQLGPGVWVELSVAADIEAVEAVSEILTRFAPGGTSVEPGFGLTNEGLGAVVDPTQAGDRAGLPARPRPGRSGAVHRRSEHAPSGHLQAFGLRPIGELQTRLVHEEDWAEAWKSHFPVLRIGRRIVIRPTWRRHRRRPDDVVLSLDPGMAFGTGLHPTTRLCLAALETLADEGGLARGHAANGGCSCHRRGLRLRDPRDRRGQARRGRALGVDTDPIAVESTRANARLNGLARRLPVEQGSVPSGKGPFDLVLANLIASLLVQLAPALRDETISGGRILASGIFRDREGDVRAAFEAAGLTMGRRWAEEDWVALEAIRP